MWIIKNKKIVISMIIIIVLLLTPLFITNFLYDKTFGTRIDNAWHLYEYMVKENPEFLGLKRDPIEFTSNRGQILRGNLYRYFNKPYDSYKGMIVMAHGYGRGHDSYMQEINYFAKNGFLVMGYDNTGMNSSDGENLIGISQSPIDLNYALQYVENTQEFGEIPILLYGQSWGGYAVSSVGNYQHQIRAIVSVAGFENNSELIIYKGKSYVGKFIGIFEPYIRFHEWLIFGENSGNSGIEGLSNANANILIIHSQDDSIVSYDENFLKYKHEFGENPRFEFLSLKNHGHNGALSPNKNDTFENGLRKIDEDVLWKIVEFYDKSI